MRVALAAVVAAVLLLVAGVVVWTLRSPATVARITAATGGTITTGDGVSVRFGPGALSEDTEVRIVPRPSIAAPEGLTWLAEPFDVSLGGGSLRTSATLTLPLTRASQGDLTTVVSRDENGVWSSDGGTVDRDAGTITTVVGHLSIKSAAGTSVRPPRLVSGAGPYDAPDPDCGTTRSERWSARADGGAVKTCVAAGAADRAALMRVASNRAYGQFAELGGYPPITYAQPDAAGVAETVWRKLAEADRSHTFLPGRGLLDVGLPGGFRTIDFVTRGGLDVMVAEYVVGLMSAAYVSSDVTLEAVRCVLALPVVTDLAHTRSPQRLPELGAKVLGCVTGAFADTPVLGEGSPAQDKKDARDDRFAVTATVTTAIRGLPAAVETLLRSEAADTTGRRVIADRSPVIPRKALNEPGGEIPAAVVATEQRLYAAAARDSLADALPPSGLIWSNTGLSGPRITDAVAALVTTPPLRWPCDATARDGYVYGLADANLLTYPARLADLGLPAEDVGIVRQTAGLGKDHRLCIALDGSWTSLTHNLPAGEFPASDAAKLPASATCDTTAPNAFLPPDSVCRSVARTDLDGDSRTDALLTFRRGDHWTARAVLAAGRVSDLVLPYEGDDAPVMLDGVDLDGQPGEEIALQTGGVLRLLSFTGDGLVLIAQEFAAESTLAHTAGIGCADVDRDGRPELVEGAADFGRDPATGAIVAASTTETRWTWRGKTLERGETIRRRLTGTQANAVAGPPYRDVTCTLR